ncbi:MAG: UDP-2,3-diacylglucosamine diphosphatase [Chitinispirillaceae bacterium]|jgi:UDP-2,3-diacylglucosamine hydrolase
MTRDTIYFFSDAHLGAPVPEAPQWEKQCIGFLRTLTDRAEALYILGDLFDFWIEYRNAIRPDYFSVIHEIRNLVDLGIPVHYFAGNHDFAFGPFITGTLGITVHPGHEETVLQGKRVHLFHGDGLLRQDAGYRLLRSILRSRVNQALYRLLPPAIGIPLASFFSATSRKYNDRSMNEERIAEYRMHAREYLDKGSDIVFLSHSHRAELSRWGDKVYCNTGAWMRTCNFATMTGAAVRLWRYREDGAAEEVPAVDRKQGSSAS